MKKTFYYLLLLMPFFAFCQKNKLDCESLKNGTFYNYPRNSDENIFQIRQGDLMKEVIIGKKDTITWKVKWKNDCTYSVKYVSGNVDKKEALEMIKNHSFDFRIEAITPDYYVYSGFFDDVKRGVNFTRDTMWIKEKQVPGSRIFFTQVADMAKLKRARFSDTSKYALLYMYRPGKFIGFAASYGIYVDDYLMCMLGNKSGFIYKILKEGKYSIGGKLPNSVPIIVDVRFGKSYYIKSTFGVPLLASLKRVDMELVADDVGKNEFLEVNVSTMSGY